MNDYIQTKQGIIIILPYDDFINNKLDNNKLFTRIKYIIENNNNTPILFVFDNITMNMTNNANDYLKKFTNIEYRKAYYYSNEYVNKNDAYQWFKFIMEKHYYKKNKTETEKEYTDDELHMLFNIQQLPLKDWHHRNRLRIVFIYLKKFGYENCINQNGQLCKNWIKYKDSIGHKELWNYTITRFFVEIFNKFIIKNRDIYFDYIWLYNTNLHDGKLFLQYYSREKLFSDYAKNNWIYPDLKQI